MLNILAGYKTYIVAYILLAKGILGYIFPDSGISPDPSGDIQLALIGLGLRKAIK